MGGYLGRAAGEALVALHRRLLPTTPRVGWIPYLAAALHLSQGTVRNYLSEAISKLGASNRVEAARIARQRGWL